MTIEFKRFTTQDWYGYAGAVSFGQDDPPLIGEMLIIGDEPGSHSAVVVIDAEGIGIEVETDEDEISIFYLKGRIHVAHLLKPTMTAADLVELGFELQAPAPSDVV